MLIDIPIPQIGYDMSWRSDTLIPYIFARERKKCWVKDCYRKPVDCHESLITRGDVQGWKPKERRILIFHPVNCIGLCRKHHNTELQPQKRDVFLWMYWYYREDFVYEWLKEISQEFKVVPPFLRQCLG